MCLSDVYLLGPGEEKQLVMKNAAGVQVRGQELVFTGILGIPTVIEGELEKVDLMENYIYVRGKGAL